MFKWLNDHPFISLVSYTILIAGSVFAFSKFYLIENTEITYSTQLETKDAVIQQKEAIIAQHEARIGFLENENARLDEEKNRYLEWLRESPDSFQYIEKQNEELKAELEELRRGENSDSTAKTEKYSVLHDSIKTDTTVVDNRTGIIISVTEVYAYMGCDLNIKVPGRGAETFSYVESGFTREYSIGGKEYQIVLMSTDYVSDRCSILIMEI